MALGAAAVLSVGPAMAQGLLPNTGIDVRPGDLRRQFERAYTGGPPIYTPGWTFNSGIDVVGAYTDPVVAGNSGFSGRGTSSGKGDFYTSISPSISVSGSGQRLSGTFFFAPSLRGYAQTGSQNSFQNSFGGQGHLIVLPDTMFVDLSANSSLQSRNGGFTPASNLSSSDTVQSTSFSVSPYAQHRFGDYGTAEIGFGLRQTMTDSQSTTVSRSPFLPPVVTGPSTTKMAHATFETGNFAGRISSKLELSTSQSTGAGQATPSRTTESVVNSYRLDRSWALLGTVGYEDVSYSGATPYKISGAIWSGGARWTPNADTTVTVTYGRRDGGNSLSIDATLAPTPRTRLSVRRSEGVSTGQEDFQNAIASADVTELGQYVDRQTGVPLSVGNSFSGGGVGSAAYRSQRTSITGSLLGDRNVYSVSIQQDEQNLVSAASTSTAAATPGTSSGISMSLSVQRDLNPAASASAYVQVGQRKATTARVPSTQDSFSFGASLSLTLSPTVSARAQYSLTTSSSTTPGLDQVQNLVLLGIHKSF